MNRTILKGIANNTILNLVAVATPKFIVLVAKENPYLTVTFDSAPPYNVIRVTVPDTDSISCILQ